MAFAKTLNVVQRESADWDNFVKTVSGTDVAAARRIALRDPQITFFFLCREEIVLNGFWLFLTGLGSMMGVHRQDLPDANGTCLFFFALGGSPLLDPRDDLLHGLADLLVAELILPDLAAG